MARIIHPRPEAGRQTAFDVVEFVDGVAEYDLTDAPNLTAALLQHGYAIEPSAPVESDDLESWLKADLIALALARGVELGKAKTKPAIIAAIRAQVPLAVIAGVVELESDGLTFDEAVAAAPEGGFAIVELLDGTVVGDGTSIVTLSDDGTATVEIPAV
ncbi:hypothetical protein [Glaciihabitans sp. dw_435]|uniref:hypothetical protein n=1 Tax=Glaciihabitans sp. dw_435 TaxID=2720081 RepID=UPI001BD40DC0|nr:hypothetical protein [Glaciihabitans sp. dw_435]